MKKSSDKELSRDQVKAMKKAVTLEWVTIAYMISVVSLLYIVMGSSQAMKAAWIEDCLALIPPIAFLIGNHFRNKKPTEHYPYGFHRVNSIGFLVSAIALLVVGGSVFVDSVLKLVDSTHPTIGMKEYFGADIWLGWWMVAALVYATIPPIIIGRMKIPLAKKLHDQVLYTDAKMNKADWMTAVAAMIGVLGIGYGIWWADAIAAMLISGDILWDGWHQSRDSVTALMNRAPKELNGEYNNLPLLIAERLKDLDWVEDADVRLNEHGHILFGEGFVISKTGGATAEQLIEAREVAHSQDWRVQNFTVTVTDQLPEKGTDG